jgi:hypothetical protein
MKIAFTVYTQIVFDYSQAETSRILREFDGSRSLGVLTPANNLKAICLGLLIFVFISI